MRYLVALLILVLAAASAPERVDLGGRSILETAPTLKPGEYIWAPELAPAGPTLLIVNIDTQRAVLFRNGVPIAASTLSSGRPGYDTPTGVFTILQKRVEHYSSTYDNAPMPYMQRLTWKGVALHAGNLPGYPASHGCIRLPREFAKLLYGVTNLGMTVVITRLPGSMAQMDGALLSEGSPEGDISGAPFRWDPEGTSRGIVSVIVSVAEQRAIVLRNGKLIGSAPVRVKGPIDGSWAYVLQGWDKEGRHWLKLRFSGQAEGMEVPPGEAGRFQAPEGFRQAVISALRPGAIIVVTQDRLGYGSAGAPVTVIEDEPDTPR